MNTASPVNVTTSAVVSAQPAQLRGWSVRDTSGSTNTLRVYDNASAASGTVLLTVQLAANASTPPLSILAGLRAVNGLYFSSTGAVEGSVWVG